MQVFGKRYCLFFKDCDSYYTVNEEKIKCVKYCINDYYFPRKDCQFRRLEREIKKLPVPFSYRVISYRVITKYLPSDYKNLSLDNNTQFFEINVTRKNVEKFESYLALIKINIPNVQIYTRLKLWFIASLSAFPV